MSSDSPCCGNGRSFAWGIAILGTFSLTAILVWSLYQYALPAPIAAARALERAAFLAEQRAAEAKLLTDYAWQDPAKDIVRLPIPRAVDLVLAEWQNPAAARSNLIARVEKATAVPPPAPAAPNPYE